MLSTSSSLRERTVDRGGWQARAIDAGRDLRKDPLEGRLQQGGYPGSRQMSVVFIEHDVARGYSRAARCIPERLGKIDGKDVLGLLCSLRDRSVDSVREFAVFEERHSSRDWIAHH